MQLRLEYGRDGLLVELKSLRTDFEDRVSAVRAGDEKFREMQRELVVLIDDSASMGLADRQLTVSEKLETLVGLAGYLRVLVQVRLVSKSDNKQRGISEIHANLLLDGAQCRGVRK